MDTDVPSQARPPIWERLAALSANTPDQVWNKVPTDLAENVMWIRRHEWRNLTAKVDLIYRLLTKQGERIMADFTKLQADVTAQTTVVASVQTLLASLSSAIADLKTKVTDPAAQAAIDTLAASVESNTAALAAAVTANTPAA